MIEAEDLVGRDLVTSANDNGSVPSEPNFPLTDNERVDHAGWGSFSEEDDPDGGGERDRTRRRRHID